jgi:hypothetical protein
MWYVQHHTPPRKQKINKQEHHASQMVGVNKCVCYAGANDILPCVKDKDIQPYALYQAMPVSLH